MAASNVGIFEDNLLTLYGLLFQNWIKREESFDISVLRFWLLFRSVLVFIAVWGYTVLKLYWYSQKSPMGFRIWYPMWFSIFPTLVLVPLRSERQLWFWIAAKPLHASLVTGMWKFIGSDGCACSFWLWTNFLRFCGFGWFFLRPCEF